MHKNQPLRITVSQPCGQNWDEMGKADKGRHCNQCKKTVIDFTALSDEALYKYFKSANTIPCGRFHTDQLNRPIIPIKRRKSYWKNLYKAAAALIAFINMKYAGASGTKQHAPVTISPYTKDLSHSFIPGKVTISGLVKDAYGIPVTDASVMLGEKVMTQTDSTGKFSFDINTEEYETGKSLLLVIRHAGLNRAVRSYNLSMMSTTYDIVLETPSLPQLLSVYMGVPSFEDLNIQPVIFTIDPEKMLLSKDAKDSLSFLAARLRNNPNVFVSIIAYPKNNDQKPSSKKQLQLVLKYMTDEEGIDEARFNLAFGKYTRAKKNVMEVIADSPYKD